VFDEFGFLIDYKVCRSLCKDDIELRIWRQLLERGSRGVILCLLLLFLPNLEAIDPTHSGFEDTVCCKMLDWTAQARHDTNILGPLALNNLSKVTLQGSEPEEGGSYSGEHCQILTPFAALPWVRTISSTFGYGGGLLEAILLAI